MASRPAEQSDSCRCVRLGRVGHWAALRSLQLLPFAIGADRPVTFPSPDSSSS